MEDEPVIWRGSPSQLLNLKVFVLVGLMLLGLGIGAIFFWPVIFLAVLPLGWVAWEFFVVRCRVFELTSQRLRLYEGVLSRRLDDVELYRVKDTAIEQPFWLRLFGLATVVVETSDRSHATIRIEAIGDAMDVREEVRKNVERLRDQKRVREIDFEGGDGDGFEGDFDAG
ncbi:MAG: PH domain-containing protein [Verrucomicrobiota bacterium]